jgi:hypothetical protein
MVFSPFVDTPISLARHLMYNVSINLAIKLNVDSGMAFEHGHCDEVQVDQLTAIADTYAQVVEQLAVMRASVAS